MKKVRMILKKICFVCGFAVLACFMAGCGNSGTEERLKTGEERAIELKGEALDAVDKVNEDTKKLNETGEDIEQE